MPSFTSPSYLKEGDRVIILAPAKTTPQEKVQPAIALLRDWGLEVVEGKHLFTPWHQFGAKDEERLSDLQSALDDPSIRAIFCVRGGYGSSRIVDGLRWEAFANSPKWLIGYSDITVLHHAVLKQGVQSLHATMPALFGEDDPMSMEMLRQTLFGESLTIEHNSHPLNRTGHVSGPVIGGNLSMLCHQVGTATEPDTTGAILFIEDVGEYLYAMDRMLVQLDRAGKLSHLKAIITGGFTAMKDQDLPFGESAEEILHRYASKYDLPLALGLPFGHEPLNLPILQGAVAELTINEELSRLAFKG